MAGTTINTNGQITLPKAVRERLHVDIGDEVDFVVNDRGEVVVRAASLQSTELKGLLKRRRKRPLTVEEMNAAIVRTHKQRPPRRAAAK